MLNDLQTPVELEQAEQPQTSIPAELPVLPVQDIVSFPFMIAPLLVTRPMSLQAVDSCVGGNRMLLLVAQKDPSIEDPLSRDLYQVGTVGIVMRMLKLPDQGLRLLVQGLARARVTSYRMSSQHLVAAIETMAEPEVEWTMEAQALARNIKASMDKAAEFGKNLSSEVGEVMRNLEDPGRLSDLVACNLNLKAADAQSILEISHPVKRLQEVNRLLARELELLKLQHTIREQAREEIEKSQREYLLRRQLKAIQEELGEANELAEEIEHLRQRAEEIRLPSEAQDETRRQIQRLERMPPDSAETAMVRNYLEWVLSLPWSVSTQDHHDLKKARKVLDQDHYNLAEVKNRILEYLAVLKLKQDMKGPILCFAGPPGVGKTSLGMSIARALGRKFARLSLGGVHDEAEIRGHRRTYVGAMPGRIIQAIRNAGTNNPVLMLDEVDKLGTDFRGDPGSALLEVLDPEQNHAFRDNFLGVPFDLSHVLFITTANLLDAIQPSVLDRMEVIRIPGYSEQDKVEIARRYLVPKQIEAHGLPRHEMTFDRPALRTIIRGYTREAGVRNLEREIATICRKVARKVAEGQSGPYRIQKKEIPPYLGVEKIQPEELLKEDRVGVAMGLAWTPLGGEIIFVEVLAMKGKGELILTGQLGEVMKESARAALSYARARAAEFEIDEAVFEKTDFHIHVPAGAVPKDGPSAGVTLAAALISALAGLPVRRDVALTGEITLRGQILPVAGLKEKVLAAQRAKIRRVLLPRSNQKNIEELSTPLRGGLEFLFVENMDELVRHALKKV